MSGCPFGGGSKAGDLPPSPRPLQEANRGEGAPAGAKPLPTGRARVQLLYEEYVKLPLLREVWQRPRTERPVLEPCFAAAFHGIELCFLLLAEFVGDARGYVAKRPRVELVADDIAKQCQLLTEVVDGELEEELEDGGPSPRSRVTLTQPFPFEGCPPTKRGPCHSPGLARLTGAISARIGGMSSPERNGLVRIVLNLCAAFSSFQRWSVGLGVEHQLNALRAAVGLPEVPLLPGRLNLDYDALVQPRRCEQTLMEVFSNPEDFFFRTIHLGTDCWASIALSQLRSAQALAEAGNWHNAAARASQAARILHYLGDHLMLLTSMNLRDYLFLKVELEGTSGEGSVQVKAFKPTAVRLFDPLAAALLGSSAPYAAPASDGEAEGEGEDRAERLHGALMGVYEYPDRRPGLYSYCKALEAVETGVLGGFYFKHYLLATNVIGSEARGTMRRAVAALKAGYEAPLFPQLDRCRVGLGQRIDAEVADRKGRIMQEIIAKFQSGATTSASTPSVATPSGSPGAATAGAARGCPFGGSAASACDSPAPFKPAAAAEGGFEAARQQLYSWDGVPPAVRDALTAEMARQAQQLGLTLHSAAAGGAAPLAFLDHAWGQMSPAAQYHAWREAAALQQLGNSAWNALFGRAMPQAAAHIKTLLGLPPDSPACTVHFGANSHELVSRLLSCFLDGRGGGLTPGAKQGGGGEGAPLRVLCTDTEFYSITRQLNRLTEAGLAEVEMVPAEPADSFVQRCCAAAAQAAAAGRRFNVVYVSQTTYLTQQTLVPNATIPALVRGLRAAACGGGAGAVGSGGGGAAAAQPLVVLDAYHGFASLPTSLAEVAGDCCYVAGLLKHAGEGVGGCGANCAFMTLPAALAAHPVLTGWLADPSVLAPGSVGIQIGSQVGYAPELALQGGTPAVMLPVLTFNHLMELWREARPAVTVAALHAHVMGLHRAFLEGLPAAGHPTIHPGALVGLQDESCRSHTLVFAQPSAEAARAAVEALARQGVLVDCRKACLRVGFGANHSASDVAALLAALKAAAAAASG